MKRIVLSIISILLTVSLFADEERQTRRVIMDQVWDCSYDRANEVIDRFVYEMQTDMNNLFTW